MSELWALGIIAPWYLREDQIPIYEILLREKNPFIECARRYGKTTSILCYVIELMLRNPGWVAMWCEPDKNQAREIVRPEMEKVFATAPPGMRPRWSGIDSFYRFPTTGSIFKLRGVNHDRGDSARGNVANVIVADEFGTWKDPDYIVTEALRPQLQTTGGPFIFASTPPEDLGHAYYDHKAWAVRDRRFIKRIIHDNASLSRERVQELIKECRGEDTPAWQREYLCEPVSNPERTVIPEYDPKVHDLDDDAPAPEFYDAYVGMDLGFNDCTAVLFGYWDFMRATLVIEDEYVVSGKNSKEIVDACKAKEFSLWKHTPPYRRIGDNDLQQLHDMVSVFGYYVEPTQKDDKLAALNALRLRFSSGKIKIKKRCESLRYQVKVGLWNDRRTGFQRGEKTGHLDAIDALIYLSRNVSESRNPFPSNVGVSQATHYINPEQARTRGKEEKAFDALFDPFPGGL